MASKKNEVIIEEQVGSFNIRITPSRVDVEADKKSWKICFDKTTFEYGLISGMMMSGDPDQIKAVGDVVRVMYSARMAFSDAKFYSGIVDFINGFMSNIQESIAENDEEILREEQVMTDQTAESIENFEKEKGK